MLQNNKVIDDQKTQVFFLTLIPQIYFMKIFFKGISYPIKIMQLSFDTNYIHKIVFQTCTFLSIPGQKKLN